MMLQIRNMESHRCITRVRNELDNLGIHYKTVELGKVELKDTISADILKLIDITLKQAGLEIIGNKKAALVEEIKAVIHELIYLSDELPKPIYSHYISNKTNYDYTYLSNVFSASEGVTIEKYIIAQKIERVKELLVYTTDSLNNIAFLLNYSSVAHLSNQFKKVTGLTPSFFREHGKSRLK